MWVLINNNIVVDIIDQPRSLIDNNGIGHPSSIFTSWSINELKKIGVYFVHAAEPINDVFEIFDSANYVYDNALDKVSNVVSTIKKTLRTLKTDKNLLINLKRKNIINSDIDWVDGGNTFIMETDKESRELLSGIVAAVAGGFALPIDFAWRTRDNISITMDSIKLASFRDTITTHVNNCFKQSWVHKAGLDAIADQTRVNLSEDAQKYKSDGYPIDTTNYPLVAAKANIDLTTATTAADAIIAEDVTLSISLGNYDFSTGWPVNSTPEVV